MMKFINCKDSEIEIVAGDPFANDKLNRSFIAQNLTKLCEVAAESGAVLALNGDWGSGKTTFIRMWRQKLEDLKYTTIYFNSWETDFHEDPFIALFSEFNNSFSKSENFKDLIISSAKIGLKAAGEITKEIVGKYLGLSSNALGAAIDEATSNYCERLIDYKNKKENIIDFKKKLSEFVASESNGKPVFFFIDELDRCNPTYAIKLLERVKHLFEVPNIIFVLSVNLEQLQYAVQGFYGSTNIDGKQYLKRFIDIEYLLPEPNIEDYTKYMMKSLDFDSFFEHEIRQSDSNLSHSGESFCNIAIDLIVTSGMNLRMINKLLIYSRLALLGFREDQKFSSDVFFLLCFIKLTHPNLYNQIKGVGFSLQELLRSIEKIIPSSVLQSDKRFFSEHHLAYAFADLILKYNYSRERGMAIQDDFKPQSSDDNSVNHTFPIESDLISANKLNEALFHEYHNMREHMYGLKSMFDKIDLLATFRLS